MRLYTICAHNRPIITISVGCGPAMRTAVTNYDRSYDQTEIGKALTTWLGEDLLCLETEGHPLWSGRRSDLGVREATADEAKRWKASHQHAIDTDEIDAGEESWLMFLVPVKDPTDAD